MAHVFVCDKCDSRIFGEAPRLRLAFGAPSAVGDEPRGGFSADLCLNCAEIISGILAEYLPVSAQGQLLRKLLVREKRQAS